MSCISPLVTNLFGIKIPSQTTLAVQPILNKTSSAMLTQPGEEDQSTKLFNYSLAAALREEEFAQWFSGFVDAEGNFQIFLDRIYVRVLFRIVLHIDDVQVLYKIKNNLGAGTVRINKDYCVYSISKQEELANILIPILDKHTLLTTKYLDYLDFKKIVKLIKELSTSRIQGNDLKLVKEIVNQMNSSRKIYDYSLIPSVEIKPYWLLGFIELAPWRNFWF